jgi:hypothetical protein
MCPMSLCVKKNIWRTPQYKSRFLLKIEQKTAFILRGPSKLKKKQKKKRVGINHHSPQTITNKTN